MLLLRAARRLLACRRSSSPCSRARRTAAHQPPPPRPSPRAASVHLGPQRWWADSRLNRLSCTPAVLRVISTAQPVAASTRVQGRSCAWSTPPPTAPGGPSTAACARAAGQPSGPIAKTKSARLTSSPILLPRLAPHPPSPQTAGQSRGACLQDHLCVCLCVTTSKQAKRGRDCVSPPPRPNTHHDARRGCSAGSERPPTVGRTGAACCRRYTTTAVHAGPGPSRGTRHLHLR